MKLSIIIVSYNTSEFTVSCIRSIEKFSPKCTYEIIVVDNASTDKSVENLMKLGSKIVLIQNSENLGFSKANNIGIRKSKGEYVFLLNSDTILVEQIFDELIAISVSEKKAGVVAPQLLNLDKSIQSSIYRLPTIVNAMKQYWFGMKNVLDKYAVKAGKPLIVESVVGAAFLITPEARKKVGLLDEKYFMYFEDLDYCRAINSSGLFIYYVPNIHIVHIHGASGTSRVNDLLVESSKKYLGFGYYFYTFVLWSGQKLQLLKLV